MKSSIEEFKDLIKDYAKYELKKEGKITPAMFCFWPNEEVVMIRFNAEKIFSQENKGKISATIDEFANHPNTKALALVIEVSFPEEKNEKIKEGVLITYLSDAGKEEKLFGLNRQTRTLICLESKNNKFDSDSRSSNFFDFNMN